MAFYRNTFSSQEELAQTLFEKTYHVCQVAARVYPVGRVALKAYEKEAKAAVEQWWASHPLNNP